MSVNIIDAQKGEFEVQKTTVETQKYSLEGLQNERKICTDRIAEIDAIIAQFNTAVGK